MSDEIHEAARQAALSIVQLLRIELHDASKSTIKARAQIARVMHAYAVSYAAEAVRAEREAVLTIVHEWSPDEIEVIRRIRARSGKQVAT